LDYDNSTTDHCGTCTACIDSCPYRAIVAPYIVDGSKCISYFTIELKEIPQEMKGSLMIGLLVVIYVNVAPWNKFSKPHNEPLFNLIQNCYLY
jgi:epoxyqueuosine reductase